MAEVEYRPIPDYPGYRVGDDGSVWSSLQRRRRGDSGRSGFEVVIGDTWRKLNPHVGNQGYRVTALSRGGQKRKLIKVAVLVLTAFVGPRPPGNHACHNNGCRNDDRLSNLRWDTIAANNHDRLLHGTLPVGVRVWKARLTESQVRRVRQRLAAGERQSVIARDYGVCPAVVSHINTGRSWKQLA